MKAPVDRTLLVRQLTELGVERGGVLLVHTSFRAIRPIEGGPEGLIQALRDAIGPDGTLVMPSWSSNYDEPFDPLFSESASSLGIVPQVFWRLPGVQRSDHVHAFGAVGPRASYVLQDGLPLPPHTQQSPVGRVHELDGQVLLLGVNHDANTTIHLAECMAAVPYGLPKYCTVVRNNRTARVEYLENDHCCQRFLLVDEWLQHRRTQVEGPVGYGTARLTRSRAVVAAALRELARNPLIFLHDSGSGCTDCDRARVSI